MPRTLTLEPTYIDGRPKPWMLRVPPYLSDTGKVKRLFYRTRRECKTAADLVRNRAATYGHQTNVLSPARALIAVEAFSLLGGRPDVALLEIIRAGLASEPWAYRWSSCRAYALGEPDALLAVNPWYEQLAVEPARRQVLWREFLDGEDPKEGAIAADDWAIGEPGFRRSLYRPQSRAVPRVNGRPRAWSRGQAGTS